MWVVICWWSYEKCMWVVIMQIAIKHYSKFLAAIITPITREKLEINPQHGIALFVSSSAPDSNRLTASPDPVLLSSLLGPREYAVVDSTFIMASRKVFPFVIS